MKIGREQKAKVPPFRPAQRASRYRNLAEKAALEDLDLGGSAGPPAVVLEKLRQQILAGKIKFNSTAFQSQLLGLSGGTK